MEAQSSIWTSTLSRGHRRFKYLHIFSIEIEFKHIKENRDKIEANPGIAQWLKVRPVTEY